VYATRCSCTDSGLSHILNFCETAAQSIGAFWIFHSRLAPLSSFSVIFMIVLIKSNNK
jgi:hypothetical protein